jgi:hypothetical protein
MQSYRVVAVGAYIHVRDTDAHCYDVCIERTGDEVDATKSKTSAGESSHE